MAQDRAPVRPSTEASQARQHAEAARQQAAQHHTEAVDKLTDATRVLERLAGHRRANNFTELFQRALDRNK